MLEGRLFTQWQFTFSRGKKDYHLLSSNVESRPPSHSSAGMWKQWGKLNSQTAHTVSCVQVRDYHNQSKHSLQHVGCSGSNRRRWISNQCRTTAFLQVFKHSKGTNGWGKRPAALAKSSSNICENLWEFSFCRLARYGCKSTLGHQHTSLLCLTWNLPIWQLRAGFWTQQALRCPSLLLAQSVRRICPTGFPPLSAHDPTFTLCFMASHTERSRSWCRHLVAAQKTSLSRLSIDHHLWALCVPLLLSRESFQPTLRNLLLFLLSHKSPPPSHELADDWNWYEILKALK